MVPELFVERRSVSAVAERDASWLATAKQVGAPTPSQLANDLQGKAITEGWDVVHAMSAGKVNDLFQRQFVLDLALNSDLPPVNGAVPIIANYSVEFVDVVLANPLIAFNPQLQPQTAALTIPILSGLVHTIASSGTVKTVVATQWITPADGYSITGVVPLGSVQGEVETDHDVVLQIENAADFVANLGMSDAVGTTLGQYFLTFIKDNANGYDYKLGTLSTSPNGTDLTPVNPFKIGTQVDSHDPTDVGRVLFFIPTKYNPSGGDQPVLTVANVVPAGMDTALFVSSEVVFSQILQPAIQSQLSAASPSISAQQSQGGAYSLQITGGGFDIGVVHFVPSWSTSEYWSGTESNNIRLNQESVTVPINGISVTPAVNSIDISGSPSWGQPWVVGQPAPHIGMYYQGGTVSMTANVNSTNVGSVDAQDNVTFSADVGVGVSFAHSTIWQQIFSDGQASDAVGGQVQSAAQSALQSGFGFTLPQIGAFAVSSLAFPDEGVMRFSDVFIPGDLVLFGTIAASGTSVTPPLAQIDTSETATFTATAAGANVPVTWSCSQGTISSDGVYTPTSVLSRPTVVVITATPTADPTQPSYAAVIVSPAQVQVSPLILVTEAGSSTQAFAASLPGSTAAPSWSISPAVGSIDPSGGIYTPPPTVTSPTVVTVTATMGAATGTATVVVFPTQPSGLDVQPYVTTPLGPGDTQAFTATGPGGNVPVTWSLIPEVGSIDPSTGLYTAPSQVASPQAALVVATDTQGSASGGTAVVLVAPAQGWTGDAIVRPA